jgi:transposase
VANSESLTILEELLNLDDVVIIESILTTKNGIIIRVESTKKEIHCRRCGELCDHHGKGSKIQLRHLPILGHKTFIELTPLGGICKKCGKEPTTTQSLSWYKRNGRYTKPYEDYILLSMINSTLADVSIRMESIYRNGVFWVPTTEFIPTIANQHQCHKYFKKQVL